MKSQTQDQQTAQDQRAPEFYPPLQAALDEIAAIDQRITANRARQAEIDALLNARVAPAQQPTPLDRVRRLLAPQRQEEAPMPPPVSEQAAALRQEFTALMREIDLLQSARIDLVDTVSHRRDKATAARRELPDVKNARAELEAACRVLLEVHQRGLALAQQLQTLGFNAAEPHGWTGAHLPSELVGFIERAAKGDRIDMPFVSYRQQPTPYVDRGLPQRQILRSASNY